MMKAGEDKSKVVKKIDILGQAIAEDMLKKMNFAETKKFCLSMDVELRKFVLSPTMYLRQYNYLEQHIKRKNWTRKKGSCSTTSQTCMDSNSKYYFNQTSIILEITA